MGQQHHGSSGQPKRPDAGSYDFTDLHPTEPASFSANQARPTHLRSGQRPHSANYISQTGRWPVGLDGTVASQKTRNAPLASQAKLDEGGDKGPAQDGGGSVYFASSAQADKSTNKETSTAPCCKCGIRLETSTACGVVGRPCSSAPADAGM